MDNVFACENCGKKFLAKEVLQHDAYCPCGETIIAYSIDAADRIAELEAENKKLSAFITMEHTDPPYDYGDSQDVQFAIRIAELEAQLAAAQGREVAYRNALMDAAKDFDQAGMGNCCQRVLDELNRIINAAEADHAESV